MTGPDTATFADHIRDPSPDKAQPVDPRKWLLPAPLIVAALVLCIPLLFASAFWVWNTNATMRRNEKLLVKIDKNMVIPSQFTEWTYEFRAANPTVNLVVPRLPVKASDQYQGE